ncbi:MAG: hypothetical protein MUE61_05875 [Vicinamibacterales bacterium]|nr:hypothetical protein [Vicinamibacterales bacterium]
MLALVLLLAAALCAGPGLRVAAAQAAEKQRILSITSEQLSRGIVAELIWADGQLIVQGAFVAPSGEIKAEYHVVPADGAGIRRLDGPSTSAEAYWRRKAGRVSPTGLGRITSASDSKMPYVGIGSLDRRLRDAADMGGVQQRHVLTLGTLVLFERTSDQPPYDGESYSWSPAELNRIAYVDGKGDLWVARADGGRPQRLLRGDYTLPAWSDDGRAIAVAERKDGGRRWEISIVHLPEALRTRPPLP